MKTENDIDRMILQRDYNGLLAIILDDDIEQRLEAFVALWNLGDIGAHNTLVKTLKAEDTNILYYGLFILGQLGNQRSLKPVRALLSHPSNFIASTAINTLKELKDPHGVFHIIKRIPTLDGPGTIIAIEALAELDQPRTIETLTNLLGDTRFGVAQAAMEGLHKLGDPDVTGRHTYVLNNGSAMQEKIDSIRALGRWGDPGAINTLLVYLNEPHPLEMYREAARAIMRIKDPWGIKLMKYIYDRTKRQDVKSSIKHALSREAVMEEVRERMARDRR